MVMQFSPVTEMVAVYSSSSFFFLSIPHVAGDLGLVHDITVTMEEKKYIHFNQASIALATI